MADLATRRQAIEELESAGHEVTAESVFEAARSPQHPLHSEFIWDGDAAIHALGIEKARQIIRSVRIEIIHGEVRQLVCSFVRNPVLPHKVQGYIGVTALRKNREQSIVSIAIDISRLENVIRAVRAKAAVLGVSGPLDEMLKQSTILKDALGLNVAEESSVG
jgi:hypothetical protein